MGYEKEKLEQWQKKVKEVEEDDTGVISLCQR